MAKPATQLVVSRFLYGLEIVKWFGDGLGVVGTWLGVVWGWFGAGLGEWWGGGR